MNVTPVPNSTGMAPGFPILCQGSQFYVLNSNTKVAEADPDDPFESATSSVTKVFKATVPPGAVYLELYHMFIGTAPTTPLKVRPFGKVNFNGSYPSSRLAPNDVVSGMPVMTEGWIGLGTPLDSTTTEHTFANVPAVASDAAPVHNLSHGILIHVAGSQEVLVNVSQASDPSGLGILVGRWRS